MVRGTVLTLAAFAGLLVLATPASAARYNGDTSQNQPVTLLTDAQNELERITFRKWKSPCQRGGGRFAETTSFIQPMDDSEPGSFFDRGFYRLQQNPGNFDIKVKSRVRGRQTTPVRWKGTFKPKAIVKRNGNFVASCTPGKLRWRARLAVPTP